tara:strand:- start:344 stop:742 length:399 start_codon:yes stop_codon:yes gene_type:complete
MIDNLLNVYLNMKGNTAAECIAARNRYGPIEYQKSCKSPAMKRFFNGPHGEFMFGPVDRNAKFYVDYRGCTSDVNNKTGKLKDAVLKDCMAVSEYWKSKGKEKFIDIPKKSNGLMYVIFFILAVFLFRKLKK